MHAKLNLRKTKTNPVDEIFKVSQMEVAAIKGVVKEQWARLDAAHARMAELKNRRDKESAFTAICCKELLQMRKNSEQLSRKGSCARLVLLRWQRSGTQ